MSKHLTPDNILSFYNASISMISIEMDRKSYVEIRTLKDHNGEYLWTPSFAQDKPSLLIDIPISVIESKERVFRLKYTFKNGTSHIENFYE